MSKKGSPQTYIICFGDIQYFIRRQGGLKQGIRSSVCTHCWIFPLPLPFLQYLPSSSSVTTQILPLFLLFCPPPFLIPCQEMEDLTTSPCVQSPVTVLAARVLLLSGIRTIDIVTHFLPGLRPNTWVLLAPLAECAFHQWNLIGLNVCAWRVFFRLQ